MTTTTRRYAEKERIQEKRRKRSRLILRNARERSRESGSVLMSRTSRSFALKDYTSFVRIWQMMIILHLRRRSCCLYAMFVLEAIVPRACTFTARGLELKILFINFRWNCARSVNGQWNAELKRIFPEVFVFPFRWTRVTRALGTRLTLYKLEKIFAERGKG